MHGRAPFFMLNVSLICWVLYCDLAGLALEKSFCQGHSHGTSRRTNSENKKDTTYPFAPVARRPAADTAKPWLPSVEVGGESNRSHTTMRSSLGHTR